MFLNRHSRANGNPVVLPNQAFDFVHAKRELISIAGFPFARE
jgi:hypothetical protein